MSETTDQRDAIVAAIAGISSTIGRVHDRPRVVLDVADAYTIDLGNGLQILRAWEVGRIQTDPRRIQQAHRHRYRTWQIRGYEGLDDTGALTGAPAYTTLLENAEMIADALDADQTLAGTMLDHEPTVIDEPDAIEIAGGFNVWTVTLTLVGYTVVSP